jgi:dephospho-CoA kinase
MVTIAVTGGIACGKSLVGRYLAEIGVPVCDADDLAREVVAQGGRVYEEIVAEFGRGILRATGEIDRAALAREVFGDARRLARLNALTHPAIMQRLRAWVAATSGAASHVAAVIPLLYEIHDECNWSAVVCVSAPERAQVSWLGERGMAPDEARQRLAAQLPLAQKMERADYVIFNCGTRDLLRRQTNRVWASICGE